MNHKKVHKTLNKKEISKDFYCGSIEKHVSTISPRISPFGGGSRENISKNVKINTPSYRFKKTINNISGMLAKIRHTC